MRTGRRILALAVLLRLATSPALGAEITGLVVGVHDGDSLTALVGGRQVKVRLADIDAPELKQAFGQRSKQSLSDLCLQKSATLEDRGQDRYGRTLARVRCNGADANREQVGRGMAWVFRKYAPRESPLYQVEAEAKAARRGLWADSNPVEPWKWRRTKGRSEVQ